jgi:hypothetical protein
MLRQLAQVCGVFQAAGTQQFRVQGLRRRQLDCLHSCWTVAPRVAPARFDDDDDDDSGKPAPVPPSTHASLETAARPRDARTRRRNASVGHVENQ